MPQTYPNQLKRDQFVHASREAECPKDVASEVVKHVTEYARQNPGYAALWCMGIGFVLGWRLKPW
jgi:hypothetical protein